MITSKLTNSSARSERRLQIKYAVLTLAIFLPLFWAFLFIRNLYPIAAWNVMMAGGDLERGRSFCILRGETVSGETIEIRPIKLTNALYSRTWTMVNATIGNQSFKLASIHPENEELVRRFGGVDNLPPGVRLPDLLQAWGDLYNKHQPPSSPQRLKAIRLDLYRWESGRYSDYDKFVETWRKEL
ncbi:MAG TPA: hypothetical protein VFR12_09520 [Pyrinomonadaceae bacterium]|nr:hypothetical protein [Pyrinomonadaceae bacterium]